ncbi:(2Fe-2S)-binding protein [Chengkuizengella axinellae]|uniref:(2Fe-2S)-binding protein n=1 Tax=Chengkuizengella axinellae TaxID=3064388 RepID=A0ABT9J1R5_9BACL|nr:(2Fe-2S)-binding protein [Chengkuizengella sp. 2205SS18-9]MDP5275532.1 (2Fe-2S)-binding protein [Chengkuizengella sp. 2205SS18-9]
MRDHKTIICRCEEVSLEDLVRTAESYRCSSRELKLRTRAGMGQCGGRTCRALVDSITQKCTNDSTPHDIPLGYQAPIRPITFSIMGEKKDE